MKPLQMLLIFAFGVLAGALLIKGCGKAKTITHWETVTDTVRIKADTIRIPDFQKVYLYQDTGSTRYVVLKVTDTLKFTRIDSIFGSPVVEARKYSDSLQVNQQDMVAKIGYDVYTADELYKIDFDISLFNSRIIPPLVINKKLRNSIGANIGYLDQFFVSLDYKRKAFGGGVIYNLGTKKPGAYLRTGFNF